MEAKMGKERMADKYLIENPQPPDWYFWLGEQAWADVPYFIEVPCKLTEADLRPGNIIWVPD